MKVRGVIKVTRTILGVVLAGGESKRFGKPKAFALKNQIPFYRYSIQAIEPFVKETVIVTNPKLKPLFVEKEKNFKILTDLKQYQGQGPLAGIYTAMNNMNASWYMVIPIDVPFVKPWVFELLTNRMGEEVDAIVPMVNGKKQPLFSLYHHSIKNKIKKQLDMGERSLHQLLKLQRVLYIPIKEAKPFININSRKDYDRFIQS